MRNTFLRKVHHWLSIKDDDALDIIMATALASYCPGDPIWLMLVSPPGGGKTEVIRTMEGPQVVTLDTLTTKTLVSGMKKGNSTQTFGILPDLDGKLVIIKDLTVMLEQNAKGGEDSVFVQLRAIYDGEYAMAHGSGHKRQSYKSRFGMIAAVTPVIDMYRSINSSLGERFLTVRLAPDSDNAIRKAQDNSGFETTMRGELHEATSLCMEHYSSIILGTGIPILDSENSKRIRELGAVVAMLRTEVPRDRFRVVKFSPGLEVGTRLVKQLTRLGEMLTVYESYDYSKILRVGRDSMGGTRYRVAKGLFKAIKSSPKDLSASLGMNYNTVKEDCEDLWLLGLCNKEEKGHSDLYSFKPDIMDRLITSELF